MCFYHFTKQVKYERLANNFSFPNTIIKIENYFMLLTHSDMEQVCPIEGYIVQEIRQCVLHLCNGNPYIRKDYLEWLGVEGLLDANTLIYTNLDYNH